MGNISDYVNEKYVLVSGVASGLFGAAVGTGVAVASTPALGLTGIVAGGVAFLAANLFRYRTQDEVNALLGIEPMELKGGPTGVANATNPRSPRAVNAHITAMMDKILKVRESLGQEIIDAIVPIFENLNEITKQWNKLEGMAEVEYTVEQIVYDYLPTSLESYTNVSKKDRIDNDASLKTELLEQLSILQAETARIRENLYTESVKPLTTQTNFLKARFGASDAPQLSLGNTKKAD